MTNFSIDKWKTHITNSHSQERQSSHTDKKVERRSVWVNGKGAKSECFMLTLMDEKITLLIESIGRHFTAATRFLKLREFKKPQTLPFKKKTLVWTCLINETVFILKQQKKIDYSKENDLTPLGRKKSSRRTSFWKSVLF